MTDCSKCGKPINWCESFDKHGHDEGDGCVHTALVANVLRNAGYFVVTQKRLLNLVIEEVGEEGAAGELSQFYANDIPSGTVIGETNPRDVLPPHVVAMLDRVFGAGNVKTSK